MIQFNQALISSFQEILSGGWSRLDQVSETEENPTFNIVLRDKMVHGARKAVVLVVTFDGSLFDFFLEYTDRTPLL